MQTPKKSETIEVRIPYVTKQAFMERCRDDGRSASEAVRAFIEAELAPPPTLPMPARVPKRLRMIAGALIAAAVGAAALPLPTLPMPARVPKRLRMIAGALIAAAVGAAALPSLAHNGLPAPVRGFVLRQEFTRLDTNHDGVVSFEEFARAQR